MRPTISKPTIDTIVSITLHVLRVSFMVKLKYSLNNQNPESFTCENIRLPAPVANTIRLGLIEDPTISGATIPAAVRPATVAEPRHTRINAGINHTAKTGCR